MKTVIRALSLAATLLFFAGSPTVAATLYVDLNNANPMPPYDSWPAAATNIQDAIDAAAPGDLVLVTNGVYATGGKVMFGDLTNRVALDKAITVQSVNGPYFTTIRGNGATNGPLAVRCAWLTNGATLQGFTLTAGATRTSGDPTNTLAGGGALCLGSNARLQNCLVISNLAQAYGGGVFQGRVASSAIWGNRSGGAGSAAAYATLLNCTVVSNWQSVATFQSQHTNTILYYNDRGNYGAGILAYCCTQPAAPGVGNITNAPQFFTDGIHLQSTSPCRGAGIDLGLGADIDGQAWRQPPSIGCDEWGNEPLIISQPRLQLTNNPISFGIALEAAGQEPLDYYWFRNGVLVANDEHFSFAQTSSLFATGVSEADAGSYQVVVSNAFGTVTSATAQLTFRFVDAANPTPVAPFTSWAAAAANIQDAIDAATPGEVILVTNGVYRSGGRVMESGLTNRVALNKAVIVQSLNGPEATLIEGNWNPTVTDGPAAVRGVWMTNGAALNGFTIRGGATRAVSGAVNSQMSGGGVWASSTNAVIYNSLLVSNTARYQGGGAYRVALINCSLVANRAIGSGVSGAGVAGAGAAGGAAYSYLRNCIIRDNRAEQERGGGVFDSSLFNCALMGNSSPMDGGAAYGGTLVNCTVSANTASGYSSGYGAAVHSAKLTNCIIWGNYSRTTYPNTNYANSTLSYCISEPLPDGVGNLMVDPQLVGDGVHVQEISPARGAGLALSSGTDIDGEAWHTPPSIGCDEWSPIPRIAVSPTNTFTYVSRRMTWGLPIAGQPPFNLQWFKDGQLLADDAHYSRTDTAGMVINRFGPEHAGQYWVVASNPFGAATSHVAGVVIHCVDAAAANPVPPYASWATAAATLQAAVDVAEPGSMVLVTNGLYVTGERQDDSGLMTRVIVDKPITVLSVNGYKVTTIEGRWDTTTNGPNAIRCVRLENGAVLAGFTIQNGATRSTGGSSWSTAGGGVFTSVYTNATVANCLLTNNAARSYGGGAYGVRLKNCLILGNYANDGGSGVASGELVNCTVAYNWVFPFVPSGLIRGGGVAGNVGYLSTAPCRIRNSIVWQNFRGYGEMDNYTPGTEFTFSASVGPFDTAPPGIGNQLAERTFLDADFHISSTSIYHGAGSALYASGEDMDGEPWADPPSMGADEVIEANLTGPLTLTIDAWQTNTIAEPIRHTLSFAAVATGRVSRIDWNYGDGGLDLNRGYWAIHGWTNPGTYTVTATAYNQDNPDGVAASVTVLVEPLRAPVLQSHFLDAGGFHFNFMAQERVWYSVQYTTNLTPPITWRLLQTIFDSPGGLTTITDPAWTNNPMRFYRVRAQ